MKYDNGAIQLNVYRGHFQARFGGEDDFRYWDLILDYDWPKYDMREWTFYPHPRAAVGDSQWHHFVVAYDYQNKRIIGWRDGELISVVDLSTIDMKISNRRTKRFPRGFTLIELLVVIAIIALSMAILMPVLQRVVQ